MSPLDPHHAPRPTRRQRHARGSRNFKKAVLAALSTASLVSAQDDNGCVSLSGSTVCSAFEGGAVSINDPLVQEYPFLQFVSSVETFDEQLSTYISTSYVRDKYQNLFGCDNVNFTDTGYLYARFTTTVLCNTLIQRSVDACDIDLAEAPLVCADTCAEFAQSEAYLTADSSLCAGPNSDLTELIRADFITCSLLDGSLTTSCISGIDNESNNCGFANSTIGFCSYCGSSGTNSTDACCYNADAESRCEGVDLPDISTTMTFDTITPTSQPTRPADGDNSSGNDGDDDGLSGGAIAGIVVGAVAGVVLLAALLFFCMRRLRRRPGSQQGSIFNQPSPARKGPDMSKTAAAPPQGYEVLPGGRIARMSALEGHSGGSPSHHQSSSVGTVSATGAGAAAGYAAGRRKGSTTQSSSDEYVDAGESEHRAGPLRAPPTTLRRNGSLSSGSVLGGSVPQSPSSAGDFSSPPGVASQQSEQLPFFKDYYSQDDIHPGGRVAVLWAYQPRAADEFALERGDMLKVVGIWDDGWATGIILDERAEEWEIRRAAQRDSGVSNTSGRRDSSPAASGEIKAFPLVCVCLPSHWRKTIEGDGSTDTGSAGAAPIS